jgi:nucleoside-diphosphate-sugar epimerase
MKVLLTGASGFVGGAVLLAAKSRGLPIRSVFRRDTSVAEGEAVTIATLAHDTDWRLAVASIDVVVHCAARAHAMHDTESDPCLAFRTVNVGGTLSLARQSAAAGVKRFIFLSSIKVNGEETQRGCKYTADDVATPEDAYGVSKAEAEAGLRLLSHQTGMEVVIIRPPLVYGPGMKGNFSSLMTWVASGLPLPLGSVTANRRSFVGLDNLVDLILTCIDHPSAANQTFLVSDNEDLSTAELLRRIGRALNRPARLIPVSVRILNFTIRLLGKRAIARRLLGSLQVDISKTCALLDWKPPVSVDEGLLKAARRSL